MGQKVNPHGFRVGVIKDWDSRWYASNEKVGDLLVTSGMGGRFPRGYPVGMVTKVEFDPGSPFAHIVAKPVAQLGKAGCGCQRLHRHAGALPSAG